MKKECEFTPEEIVKHAEGNHIFVNAFSCIAPTDAFCADVGREVLRLLDESEMVDSFIGRTKVVYVRLNKS